jgi:hypothetical protein
MGIVASGLYVGGSEVRRSPGVSGTAAERVCQRGWLPVMSRSMDSRIGILYK